MVSEQSCWRCAKHGLKQHRLVDVAWTASPFMRQKPPPEHADPFGRTRWSVRSSPMCLLEVKLRTERFEPALFSRGVAAEP